MTREQARAIMACSYACFVAVGLAFMARAVSRDDPAPARPSALGVEAQRYIYSIPECHRAIGGAVLSEAWIETEADLGRRAVAGRNAGAPIIGEALGAALKASGGIGPDGTITDRRKVADVFVRMADDMQAVLRPKPAYLGK